jgi:serine/threonine-protein kinase
VPERYIGKTLGKYRVEELIGTGGFAWVYRGFDPELEIPVALKVLKPQYAGDATFEERFRREASTAARLRHPNIVKIYAVGRDGDAVYFAMDYLPSGLAEKLEAIPMLAEEMAIRVGIDVARALGFAHREGVIHRDIKVDNILFDGHGNAVVADFGIARAVSAYTQQTGTNMVVGTPQYFAPEQARAKPLDGRADIYSLGVSLYRSVTGRLPFDGDDWYEIARQHVEEVPPRIRAINPAISAAFERVILRCLAKHPDDRPATGEQLCDDLTAVLALPRDTSPTGGRPVLRSPTDTPTLVEAAGARGRQRLAVLLPVAAAVAALGAISFPFVVDRLAPAAAEVPDSAATVSRLEAVVVSPSLDPPPVGPDSAARDSGAAAVAPRPDSAPRPPARSRVASLALTAPDGATIMVNGVAVEGTSWRRDSLAPGTYVVQAVLPSASECETARDRQSVTLRAGAPPLRVALNPRPCGELSIRVRNVGDGARYLVSADGRVRGQGPLPLEAPLILTYGVYTVRIEKPGCEPYEATVSVGGQPVQVSPALICGSAPLPDS